MTNQSLITSQTVHSCDCNAFECDQDTVPSYNPSFSDHIYNLSADVLQ